MYELEVSIENKRTLPSPTQPSAKRVKSAPAPLAPLQTASLSSLGSSFTRAGPMRPPPSPPPPSTNIPGPAASSARSPDSGRIVPGDSASKSGLSSGSSGSTLGPDVWVKVVANLLQQTFALVTMITEVKIHLINPSLEAPRRDKAREAFTQTILYLVATWEICGTWLGSWIVNSKFGRMCIIGREECIGFDSELLIDVDHESDVVVAVEAPSEQVNKLHSIKLSALLESRVNLFDILPHDIFKGYKDDGMPQVDENDEIDFDGSAVNLITSVFVIAVELAASIPFGQPLQRLPGPSTSFQKYCKVVLDQCLYSQPDSKDHEQLVVVRRKPNVGAMPPGKTYLVLGAVPQGLFPNERPTNLAVSVDDNTTESTSAYDGETEELQGPIIGKGGHKSEGDGGFDAKGRGGGTGYDGGFTQNANEDGGELGKEGATDGHGQTRIPRSLQLSLAVNEVQCPADPVAELDNSFLPRSMAKSNPPSSYKTSELDATSSSFDPSTKVDTNSTSITASLPLAKWCRSLPLKLDGRSRTSPAAVGSNSTQGLMGPTDELPSVTAPEAPLDFVGRWLSSSRDPEEMESVGSGSGRGEDFPEARPAWLNTVRIVFVSPNTMTEMICKRREP